jgi:hypothetical protein
MLRADIRDGRQQLMSTNQRTLRPSICFHERNDAVVLAI